MDFAEVRTMEYEVGVWLERIETKLDYLINKLCPPEKKKEKKVEE